MTRRIVYVIDSFKTGGAQRQLLELVRRLDKAQYRVAVCPVWDIPDLERSFVETGVEIIRIHKRHSYDFTVAVRLARFMRQFQPAIVHTWLFTGSLWGRLAAAMAWAPVIVAAERSVRPDGHDAKPLRLANKVLAPVTDVITANSQAGISALQRQGYAVDKLRLLRNGVDTALFSPNGQPGQQTQIRSSLHISPDTLLLGMVARLDYPKDYATLLNAIRIVVDAGFDVHCLIIGTGPHRARLESLASDLGIAALVHFLGERTDVSCLLQSLDVFAFSSLWEGMPNAVLEAMACGLPVVASDVAGTAEAVVDGVTGFLTPAGDADALADRILQLLRDPKLRAAMGEAGRARAVAGFSMEAMVAQTIGLYDELLARKEHGHG